ncbi:cytochrome P450 [Lanmaoa asiatica]|nr:cytochrome P450 [Lanmaoa asiatica]
MSYFITLPSHFPSTLSATFDTFGLQTGTGTPLTHVASGIVAVVVVAYLFKRIRARPLLDGVPVPGGHSFLWGHQRTVAEKSVGTAFATWMDELHARVFKIRGALFNSDILVVCDPLAATHIMQKHVYDYPHGEVARSRIARLLGKSLGWVEGESEHRRMRALVAPSLSPEALRAGTPDVYIAAENLADNLKTHILEHDGKCEINIVDWANQATLEAIGRFGFGHDFEGGRSDDARKILSAWRLMASMGISMTGFYVVAILCRFPLLDYLPLKALRLQGDVSDTIHQGIAKELLRRNQVADQGIKGNDLLSRLTFAHSSGSISTKELMDHITMLIVAGSETTGRSLAYVIWELARHPDIQSRLREEVMSFPGSPSYDDLQTKLPYLDAVTREVFLSFVSSLRMHPSVPFTERVASKDDILPLRHPITRKDGKEITSIPISPGQTVILPFHTINRMNSVWDDGANFRPERWMEELPKQDLCTTGWSRILTFSDGPRNCIGYRFAILQFKVLLFTLTQRFQFDDTGAVIISKVASSMQPVIAGEEHKGPRLPVNISLL